MAGTSCVVPYTSQLASFVPPARTGNEATKYRRPPQRFAPDPGTLYSKQIDESNAFVFRLAAREAGDTHIAERGIAAFRKKELSPVARH
jgi:hypothetical protein